MPPSERLMERKRADDGCPAERPDPAMSLGSWAVVWRKHPQAALALAHELLGKVMETSRCLPREREDLRSASLLRVVQLAPEVARGDQRPLRPWLAALVSYVWREHLRVMRRKPGPLPEEGVPSSGCRPLAILMSRETRGRILVIVPLLPPPSEQIAALLLQGWGRGAIVAWLQEWEPSCSRPSALRHIRTTLERVRESLGARNSPRELWPDAYTAKNPRTLIIPAPLPPLAEPGSEADASEGP